MTLSNKIQHSINESAVLLGNLDEKFEQIMDAIDARSKNSDKKVDEGKLNILLICHPWGDIY